MVLGCSFSGSVILVLAFILEWLFLDGDSWMILLA